VLKKALIIHQLTWKSSINVLIGGNFRRTHAAPEAFSQETYSCSCMGGWEDRFPGYTLFQIIETVQGTSGMGWMAIGEGK
jgi:hypothetical protein